MKHWNAGKITLCILAGIAMVAAFSFVLMLLWNWLVPDLFNGPPVTFWQALGLLVLSKMLFSGFGGKGGDGDCKDGKWKRRRTAHMTPEEKEKLRQRFKCKWEEDEPADPDTTEKKDV